jgi:hypothetical protein
MGLFGGITEFPATVTTTFKILDENDQFLPRPFDLDEDGMDLLTASFDNPMGTSPGDPDDLQLNIDVTDDRYSAHNPSDNAGGVTPDPMDPNNGSIGTVFEFVNSDVIEEIDLQFDTKGLFRVNVLQLASEGATTGTSIFSTQILDPEVTGDNPVQLEEDLDVEISIPVEPGFYAVLVTAVDNDPFTLNAEAEDVEGEVIRGNTGSFRYLTQGDLDIGLTTTTNTAAEFVLNDDDELFPDNELYFIAGEANSATLSGTDAEGNDIFFHLVDTVPSFLSEWIVFTDNGDGTATISGTPTVEDIGLIEATIQLTDSIILPPELPGADENTQVVEIYVVSQATPVFPLDERFDETDGLSAPINNGIPLNWSRRRDVTGVGNTNTWDVETVGGEGVAFIEDDSDNPRGQEWLVTRPVALPAGGDGEPNQFTFSFEWSLDAENFLGSDSEILGVDGNVADAFVLIDTDDAFPSPDTLWAEDDPETVGAFTDGIASGEAFPGSYADEAFGDNIYVSEIPLNDYAGDTIYIAFVYNTVNPNQDAAVWVIDSVQIFGNDEFDLEVDVYVEPNNIPRAQVTEAGVDFTVRLENEGFGFPDDAVLSYNVTNTEIFVVEPLLESSFTDGVFEFTVNVNPSTDLDDDGLGYELSVDVESPSEGAFDDDDAATLTVTDEISRMQDVGTGETTFGVNNGLGTSFTLNNGDHLEGFTITWDGNDDDGFFEIQIVDLGGNPDATSGTIVARLDEVVAIDSVLVTDSLYTIPGQEQMKLDGTEDISIVMGDTSVFFRNFDLAGERLVAGNNTTDTYLFADDPDFADEENDSNNDLYLPAGTYMALINPTNSDNEELQIDSDNDREATLFGSFRRGNADAFFNDPDDAGNLNIAVNVRTNDIPSFEDGNNTGPQGANGALGLNELRTVEGVAAEKTVFGRDNDQFDVLSYSQITEPSIIAPPFFSFSEVDGVVTLSIDETATAGDYTAIVVVSDGLDESELVLDIEVLPNPEPNFTTNPVVQAFVGTNYSYVATGVDPLNEAVTVTAVDVPAWLTATPNGDTLSLAGVPMAGDEGSHPVVLRIEDASGKQQEQAFEIEVFPAQGQNLPEFVSTAVTEAVEGGSYGYNVRVNATGGYAVTLDAPTLPAGFNFDDNGGGLGSLTADPVPAAGSYPVVLRAFNMVGDTATQSFEVVVEAPNAAPVAADPQYTTIEAGSPLTVEISATDADGDDLVFTSLSLPPWASLVGVTSSSARVKGFPARDEAGSFDVAILVTDGQLFDTASFTVTVTEPSSVPNDGGVGDGAEDQTADASSEVDASSSRAGDNIEDISVYPNPSSNFVKIASPVAGTVYMYDVSGALVNVFPVEKDVNEVDLSRFNNGLYLMKIVSVDGSETIRLRIQK